MNALPSLDGTCRITDRGVIRASGADAATFLQGQLTNDVIGLGAGQARMAGFCSAKGRLQASFIVWREGPEEFLLVCASSVLPQTLKRLSMFVLRAKCKLIDASGELGLHGAVGATATAAVSDRVVWSRTVPRPGLTMLRLPDAAGLPRAHALAPIEGPEPFELAPPLSPDAWRWLEIESGIVTIEAATADLFVPQMVNFELVGGVDFQKGCYPGQEVVARSQYRGTTKRRTFLFDVADLPAPGADVFASGEGAEPAGTVANAALRPDGHGATALVELRLAKLGGAALHLGSPTGPALTRRELPYAVAIETESAA